MQHKHILAFVLIFSLVAVAVGIQPSASHVVEAAPHAAAYSFSNTTLIDLPAGQPGTTSGPANPYPSAIAVAGIPGNELVIDVQVTLTGLSHTFPDDLDFLLEGPGGQSIVLMSDACGSTDIVTQNFTFSDAAGSAPTDTGPCTGGTYLPSNIGTGDTFNAPAPAAPSDTALAAFNGVDPNGTWNLYGMDDVGLDSGSISGGWTLDITTVASNDLTVLAACDQDNLELYIIGDGPFDVTGTGPDLPGVAPTIGWYDLIGPGDWTGVTVTEQGGDLEFVALGDFSCPSVAAVDYPNKGEIMITVGAPVQTYAAPGEYATNIVLPADYDGNGYDTYVITGSTTVAGETWYAVWVGGPSYLWVPASQVQVLR